MKEQIPEQTRPVETSNGFHFPIGVYTITDISTHRDAKGHRNGYTITASGIGASGEFQSGTQVFDRLLLVVVDEGKETTQLVIARKDSVLPTILATKRGIIVDGVSYSLKNGNKPVTIITYHPSHGFDASRFNLSKITFDK